MLTQFAVVHEHAEPLNRVLIHCFDDRQLVLVFVSREAIDDYFRRTNLTPSQRNLLMDRNLQTLIPVIVAKHEGGEVGTYTAFGGHQYPQIDLSLEDLEQTPEKLTDSVLAMAARAAFQSS